MSEESVVSECTKQCGADQDGGHWHSLGGYVWAQFPRRQARPATPDTTGGELQIDYIEAALRDLIAERDTLAAQVQAVEGLAEELDREGVVQLFHGPSNRYEFITARIRRALGTPTTGGGE